MATEEPRREFLDYPYPIALTYQRIFDPEIESPLRVRRVIKCFATTLKFLGVIAINEYLHARAEAPSPSLDKLLRTTLRRPSMGHWCQFLREIVKHLEDEMVMEELGDFFLEKVRKSARKRLPEELIALRNQIVHPDIWPNEEESSRHLKEYLPKLEKLLEDLSFLEKVDLVGELEGRTCRCHGIDPERFRSFDGSLGRELSRDNFYLVRRDRPGEPQLELSVFFWIQKTPKRDEDIYLYESLKSKTTLYILGDNYIFERATVARLEEILQRFGADDERHQRKLLDRERAANQEAPSWKRIWVRSRVITEELIDSHRKQLKYQERLYTDRSHARRQVEEFLNSDKTFAVMVGRSGYGKTNFICDICRRLLGPRLENNERRALLEGERELTDEELASHPDIVLHYSGREFDEPDVTRRIAENLVLDPDRLGDYFEQLSEKRRGSSAKARFLLIFDGVNEHHEGAKLFHAIDELSKTYCYPWLKILVCVRTAFWDHVDTWFLPEYARTFQGHDEEGGALPYIHLSTFTREELRDAYERYLERADLYDLRIEAPFSEIDERLRQLLRDPLTLRFFAQTYRAPPEDLFTGQILMDRYGTIPRKRRAFFKSLLAALWEIRIDSLPEAVIRERPKLAEYVFEDPLTVGWRINCEDEKCRRKETCPENPLHFFTEKPDPWPICEIGEERVEPRQIPAKTTYDYLLDEGILTEYGQPDDSFVVRFTYDRFFEIALSAYLAVSHAEKKLTTRQRVEETFEAVGNPQLRDALLLYLSLVDGYRLLDESGHEIESAEHLFITANKVLFVPRDRSARSGGFIHEYLEELLSLDEAATVSFLVSAFVQHSATLTAGPDSLLDELFEREKAIAKKKRKRAVPGLAWEVIGRVASEVGRVDILLSSLEWGRPLYASSAVEHIYQLCARSIAGKSDAYDQVLEYVQLKLSRLDRLIRNHKIVKPLAAVLLRVGTVHFQRRDEVIKPLVAAAMSIPAGIPGIGGTNHPICRALAWPFIKFGLRIFIPMGIHFVRHQVENTANKSEFLRGTSFEQILSLGPADPDKLRTVLPYLGARGPAPDRFWEVWEEFANPKQGETTVPSVKSGLVSSLFFARMMVEPKQTIERTWKMLRRVSVPWMWLTISNAYSYVALARGSVDQLFVEEGRRLNAAAEEHAEQQFLGCHSFAGMANYPVDQLTTVEMTAGIRDLEYASLLWSRAVEQGVLERIAFVLANLLPTGAKWPREVLRFVGGRLRFGRAELCVLGTDIQIPKPQSDAIRRSDPEPSVDGDTVILTPLRELMSALDVDHPEILQQFFIRQEIDTVWQDFLVSDHEHERLQRYHSTKSIGRFTSMTLHRSADFRHWALRLFESWFDFAKSVKFRSMNARGVRKLVVGALTLMREVVDRYDQESLLPWQPHYEPPEED